MPKRTTIAELLCHVFTRLGQSMPTAPTPTVSLLDAWTGVLGGSNRSAFDVVGSIGIIRSAVVKLQAQIQASARLQDIHKRSALQTVAGFLPLFEINKLAENSFPLRGHCNATQIGYLGLIGHSLETEFTVPALEKPDADELIETLTDVKRLLDVSTISLELRFSLCKHVDFMIWWLAHPEMASLQDLFESVGSAMVVAKQMTERDPPHGSPESTATKSIFEHIGTVATKIGRMVGLDARGVDTLDKLSGGAHHILENFTPPS